MKELYRENKNVSEPQQWQMQRRKWLKLALAGVVVAQLPWLTNCVGSINEENFDPQLDGKGILTNSEMKFLLILQNLLVPNDGNGPSAEMVNAHSYFIWMLQDVQLETSEKDYFINGLKDLKSLCKDKFGKQLEELSAEHQNLFIKNNIGAGWTQTYLSRMITVIFEAMLLDPIYGVNTAEQGWAWLEHQGGQPRPNNDTKYPEIYTKIPLYD